MTVSVVITCHNEERYIAQAVRSVVAQTAFDQVREIIVVNDGSCDNSQVVLQQLANEIERLQIIATAGLGPSAARNRALREAKGAFIAFLDGDDYWTSEKLAQQLPAFAKDPCVGLVYGDFVHFSRDDASDARTVTVRRYHPESPHHLRDYFIHDGPIVPSTAIIRRAVFNDVGVFDETLRTGEDTEFCLRVARKWRFCHVPEAFTFKRRHTGQLTHRLEVVIPNVALVTERFCDYYPELRAFANRRMARVHAKVSIHCAIRGEQRNAIDHALIAVRLAPLFSRAWLNLLLVAAPTQFVRPFYNGAKRLYHCTRRITAAV